MEDQILDEEYIINPEIRYAKLWQRINALVFDSLMAYLFYQFLKHFVFINYSTVVLSFVLMIYKPFMEHFFGGTLGKMFVKINVSTPELVRPTMSQVILRNIVPITYQGINLLIISGTMDQLILVDESLPYLQWLQYIFAAIIVIDVAVLYFNPQNQSLHDQIAKTIVVQNY